MLHATIATAEVADDLDTVELGEPVEKKVFSDVQQALAPLVHDLGTDRYGADGAGGLRIRVCCTDR